MHSGERRAGTSIPTYPMAARIQIQSCVPMESPVNVVMMMMTLLRRISMILSLSARKTKATQVSQPFSWPKLNPQIKIRNWKTFAAACIPMGILTLTSVVPTLPDQLARLIMKDSPTITNWRGVNSLLACVNGSNATSTNVTVSVNSNMEPSA